MIPRENFKTDIWQKQKEYGEKKKILWGTGLVHMGSIDYLILDRQIHILHFHCRGLEATRPTAGQNKYLYMLNDVRFEPGWYILYIYGGERKKMSINRYLPLSFLSPFQQNSGWDLTHCNYLQVLRFHLLFLTVQCKVSYVTMLYEHKLPVQSYILQSWCSSWKGKPVVSMHITVFPYKFLIKLVVESCVLRVCE